MRSLVIADLDKGQLAAATYHVIEAARQLGAPCDLLVVGEGCADAVTRACAIAGIERVLVADDPVYAASLAENLAPLVVAVSAGYSHLLAAAGSVGKDLMPRVAARLGVNQLSEVIGVESSSRFRRPIYAGNAIATVESDDPVKVLTVRQTAFAAVEPRGGDAERVELEQVIEAPSTRLLGEQRAESERPELTSARVVVSGGRGLGSREGFELVYQLADRLEAAVGASRAAVDAGFVANDLQVGQTGKVVAPELYIALGVSGAIQHLAGMKDSKVVVAINKDPDAPIFQVADYGLVADLFEAVPELIEQI
ncbi:electron transfer flavoprotein subunit alpha/FixB family protein [Marichromatium bheemlicum]|uniref:Electron transfer flavoprotein subunit alpha/FixB family protein n=1 Tax=Marichromatium bheemlicum TaxID=365339 RepID=A0ABX1I4L6_9GAMM|nr:FAD-binding protein [Marichromatium bheemlicum]NKN32499.1 electron transfer flavoprotein subunit alpha/FixB family protein [Marichromatium bheemlicum]